MLSIDAKGPCGVFRAVHGLGVLALVIDPIAIPAGGASPVPGALVTLWPIVQVVATTCLAITLSCGPGLLWFLSKPRSGASLAAGLFAGPATLVALGLACWALGGWIPPVATARMGVAALLALLALRARRMGKGGPRALAPDASAAVCACALLTGFGIAKANISYGAAGELYGGSVSRTLEVGGHSDSRISFSVVQVVAHHYAPFGPAAAAYFSPWSFASRGPLAGLLASPVVLATGAKVPVENPDQPWQPFDTEGFAAYRIELIVLASLAGWAVFGVASGVLGKEWAALACATTFLAPFFVHEMYFTWPKLIAAACVLSAFQFIRERRWFAAGLATGVGYLFHPMALLSAPFLALWMLGGMRSSGVIACCRQLVLFGVGALLLVAPWQAVGLLGPVETRQSGFLGFILAAYGGPATWAVWLQSRWESLLNTFVPFWMLTGDMTHQTINAYQALSDGWIHFGFLYWNTFPFAVGLPAFLVIAPALAAATRRAPAATLAIFAGPACLLVVYMGAASTGLMRYCGQTLFLSSILFAVWTLAQPGGGWRRKAAAALSHPAFLVLRAADIAWMALATTLHNRLPDPSRAYGWNDLLSLLAALGCLAGATVLLGRAVRGRDVEGGAFCRPGPEA
jgi:hypothetical protein